MQSLAEYPPSSHTSLIPTIEEPSQTQQEWTVSDSAVLYNIHNWGAPYFSINEHGNIAVSPLPGEGPALDLTKVIRAAREHDLNFPLVLRFQDILRHKVRTLNEAFREAIAEQNYQGRYLGVFPIKVNQLREVVEEILDAGLPYNFGLEAGSKPELIAALALHKDPESLIICNGYKDQDFIRLALMGRKLGKKIILVAEKASEIPLIIRVADEMQADPLIGIRIRLQCRSAGKWATSSGEDAKFGLSSTELLEAAEFLKAHGRTDALRLVHFHVGSQIPDIQIVKKAVREATRYYVELRRLGFPVEYLDVGGGLGIDYDGSRSPSESSANYSTQEYCADVTYNIADICNEEKVPHPHIVSESGRAIVSQHSLLIVEAFGTLQKTKSSRPLPDPTNLHRHVRDLIDVLKNTLPDNPREALHDAMQIREQADTMFQLGLLDLRSKAAIDDLYWRICSEVTKTFETDPNPPEEILSLRRSLAEQYTCNFSVFQSLLDHWALKQLFPVLPISGLNKQPIARGTIVDITCDSDGKVSTFVNNEGITSTLPLHPLPDQYSPGVSPYLLGFFLVGAYQDVMGDIHNLFGTVDEAHVFLDPDEDEGFYIEEAIPGATNAEVLTNVQYDIHQITEEMKAHVDAAIRADRLKPNEGIRLLKDYEKLLKRPTYLRFNGGSTQNFAQNSS